MHKKVTIASKFEIDFQFACPGAESGADLWWYFLVAAALVLWAYSIRLGRRGLDHRDDFSGEAGPPIGGTMGRPVRADVAQRQTPSPIRDFILVILHQNIPLPIRLRVPRKEAGWGQGDRRSPADAVAATGIFVRKESERKVLSASHAADVRRVHLFFDPTFNVGNELADEIVIVVVVADSGLAKDHQIAVDHGILDRWDVLPEFQGLVTAGRQRSENQGE